MIEELGILIGLCAVTWGSYVANRWNLHKWLAAVTAVAGVFVVAHMAYLLTTRVLADDPDPGIARPARTTSAKLQVHRTPAGDFAIEYGFLGLRKIADTKLQRERFVFENPDMPLRLDVKTAGIRPVY